MAYGIILAPGYQGKIFLSVLRLLLILFISYFLYKNVKKKSSNFLVIPTSFIFSGAIGNFLDSALYGLLFDTGTVYHKESHKWISYTGISKISGFLKKGYASFMEGCVVDMFSIPVIETNIPYWVPFFGGGHFQFFKPVFNFSDFVIFLGIVLLLMFRKKIENVEII